MKINRIYDVIVVGAGPAGGFSSFKLAEKGLKILLIEKKKIIGEPVQCGEGLSEYALEENKIKKEEIYINRKIKGSKTFTPSGFYFIFPIEGYLIKRNKFDQYLAEISSEKGTEIKKDEIVLCINKINNYFKVISNKDEYYSRYVILATGTHKKIQGINYPKFKEITAIEFRFKKNKIDDEYFHFHFGNDFKPFYGWVFFHNEETGIGSGFYGRKNTIKAIEKLTRCYEFKKLEKIKVVAGRIPFSKPVFPDDPEGLLRVGDSIGAVHPFTAGGIHGALTTGRIAAETIIKFFESRNLNNIYYKKLKKIPIFKNSLWNKQSRLFSKNSKEWDEIGRLMNKRIYKEIPWIRAFFYLFFNPFSTFNILFFLNLQKAFKFSENYSY
ncbi:MAG: NAD(P)/FAD-dependent oxidoreductase [Candidatus Hydrothermales bacterium]